MPGQDPEEVESQLIDNFQAHYGVRPHANGKRGKRFA